MIFGIQDVKRDVFGVGAAVQGATALAGAGLQYSSTEDAIGAQRDAAANSLGFQKDVFNTQQANEAPWLQAGQGALSQLSAGTAPGGQFTQGYGQTFNPGQFNAPTGVTEQNDPGYQFRLQQGQQALDRSAAARGTGTGGAALKAAQRYGQDYTSNEYGNVYNRALQGYNANYQSGLGAFNTNYNVFQQQQGNQYNRLASLAGLGQTATGQLNQAGQAAAGNVAGINQTSANNIGNLGVAGGNSLSAGLVGAGNAINSGINNYQNYQALQGILNQNQSGYGSGGSELGGSF